MTDGCPRVRVDYRNTLYVLYITGELDTITADTFVERVVRTLGNRGPVVVDLSGLAFVDARGARALITVIRGLAGRLVAIRSCQLNVRRALDMLGLTLDSPAGWTQQGRRAVENSRAARQRRTGAAAAGS